MTIDLNADVGESFGAWRLGDDELLMASITSASIACGWHAGDPGVMRQTTRLAREAGVAVGAHPGLPDLVGFGRREMAVSPREVEDLVLYQLGALAAIAAAEGVRLAHVKAHGALYGMAARDRELSKAFVRAVAACDRSLFVIGPPGSELLRMAEDAGLRWAAEGFADRAYEPDGSLTRRSLPNALVLDPVEVVARSLRMVREGVVRATDGRDIPMRVTTLCLHGDTPGAGELARRVRAGLQGAGLAIQRLGGGKS